MKITITGPARRFESELDDQEGETLFRKIVGMIAEAATGGKPQLRPGGKARSMGTPAAPPALRPAGGSEDQQATEAGVEEQNARGADPETAPAEKLKRTPRGAWGFLIIRCPSCGKERAFHTRNEVENYRCRECNTRTELEAPLREVFTVCSCRKAATYRTNVKEGRISVPCVACGELIPCEYNPERGAFLYIRGGQKAAREVARREAQKAAKKAAENGDCGNIPIS